MKVYFKLLNKKTYFVEVEDTATLEDVQKYVCTYVNNQFSAAISPDKIKILTNGPPYNQTYESDPIFIITPKEIFTYEKIDEKKLTSEFVLQLMQENELLQTALIALKEGCSEERLKAVQTWQNALMKILLDHSNKLDAAGVSYNKKILLVQEAFSNLLAKSDPPLELLAILESADIDLANVIAMRCLSNHKKGNRLFVINENLFDFLSCRTNEKNAWMVTKFSVLFHYPTSQNPRCNENYVVNNSVSIVEIMPALKDIVLRNCYGSGQKLEDNLVGKNLSKRQCTVLSHKKPISTLDLEVGSNQFLFQQKTVAKDGGVDEIITTLKFRDINNNLITLNLSDIPKNSGGNKLDTTVERCLAMIAKEHDFPPLYLPTLESSVAKFQADWLQNKTVSPEDKKILKATKSNFSTYSVPAFAEKSFAHALDKELIAKGRNITIKAYYSVYNISPTSGTSGNIEHGRSGHPKALKKQ